MTALMLILPSAVFAQKSHQVTPAESFYGYVNQEFFAEFDSGIEGAHVDPLYGELITDDPELEFVFDKLVDTTKLVEVDQANAAVAEVFEGEGTYQQGTAAQRVYDLYDSLKHAADDRAADEALFMTWVEMITRADDPAQFIDTVKAIYRETGVNVLYDITAAQDKTNTTFVKVRMAAPLDGARVAIDPEAADKYLPLYRAAMAEAVSSLGLDASPSDIEEACRLQAAFNLGYPLLEELEDVRRERIDIPEENYSRDDLKADEKRLEKLYPDADYTAPEELNETDAEVYLSLIYTGQMYNIPRPREELAPVLCSILDDAGFVYDQVIVMEEDLAAMTAVTAENLTAFKANAILRLAEQLPFVPSAAAEPLQRMKRAADCAFWGSDTAPKTEEDLSDEALRADVLTLLPQDKGLIWAEKYYDPALEERVADLTDRIKAAYAVRIEKNEWLESPEKKMMIAKLNNMVTIIGVPTEENCVFPVITSRAEGGSLLVNRTALKRAELQKTLRMVNEPGYDRRAYDQLISYTSMFFHAAMYEAVDNTAMNAIIIPAGIIAYAADPEDESAYMAALGSIVAHEIGHAFDAGGSLHNEKGAFENWWTEASRAEFHRLEKIFDEQYSRFPMVEGMYHNFSGNMQENMADFAGMCAVLDVAGDDPDTLRDILEAYASMFAAIGTKASLEEYTYALTADNHAYKSIRVNALVSSLDRFYELYDVKEGDPMYTAPEARPRLW